MEIDNLLKKPQQIFLWAELIKKAEEKPKEQIIINKDDLLGIASKYHIEVIAKFLDALGLAVNVYVQRISREKAIESGRREITPGKIILKCQEFLKEIEPNKEDINNRYNNLKSLQPKT